MFTNIFKTVDMSQHQYCSKEISVFRKKLLIWYGKYKRDMPWRGLKGKSQDRGYAILVSEVMLQQTQVSTVLKYYQRWMERWPTLADLSVASIEEVLEVWSGLGYYSRGRRLLELAKTVSELPTCSKDLEKLPGIGRYTAGAVASIAFGECIPAVDGNVTRVVSRLRAVGGNTNASHIKQEIWNIAASLVDPKKAGNFNEAMMELGSTICLPKNPKCQSCPVNNLCLALTMANTQKNPCDIEDCHLCIPPHQFDIEKGVINFPQKSKKKKQRKEKTLVCVVQTNTLNPEYLLMKRSSSGLLGGLWEFLCSEAPPQLKLKHVTKYMKTYFPNNTPQKVHYVGDVIHLFSHIHQTYIIYKIKVNTKTEVHITDMLTTSKWMTEAEFNKSAVSTGMKKVLSMVLTTQNLQKSKTKNQVSKKKQKNNVI